MLHAFNLKQGFKPSDFTMPERARGNPPLTAGSLKGITLDFEELKRQYYEAMSMDYTTGKIHPDRIKALGLQDIL
jgi:aldehyde:ferredoxin oxidoreductase